MLYVGMMSMYTHVDKSTHCQNFHKLIGFPIDIANILLACFANVTCLEPIQDTVLTHMIAIYCPSFDLMLAEWTYMRQVATNPTHLKYMIKIVFK